MADMTASGWSPAGAVVVMRTSRTFGVNQRRRALVQMNYRSSWFGTGAAGAFYPSMGIPAPNPSTVGFREYISYIIPCSPFMSAAGNGPTTFTGKIFPWGCVPPTFGASGATGSSINRLRLLGGPAIPTETAGAAVSFKYRAFHQELTTDMAATDIATTGLTYTAFAIFVGK